MAREADSHAQAADIIEQVRRRLMHDSLTPQHESAVRFYRGPIRLGGTASSPHFQGIAPEEHCDVAVRLRALQDSLLTDFERVLAAIGDPPPAPSSFRGRVGRLAVVILRRLLWWYTRSVLAFGDAVSSQFQDQTAVLAALALEQEAQRAELQTLRQQVRELSARQTGTRE